MTDVEYMIECMTKDLVILLMERRHMDIEGISKVRSTFMTSLKRR